MDYSSIKTLSPFSIPTLSGEPSHFGPTNSSYYINSLSDEKQELVMSMPGHSMCFEVELSSEGARMISSATDELQGNNAGSRKSHGGSLWRSFDAILGTNSAQENVEGITSELLAKVYDKQAEHFDFRAGLSREEAQRHRYRAEEFRKYQAALAAKADQEAATASGGQD